MTTVRATGATPLTIRESVRLLLRKTPQYPSIQRIFELSRPLRCPYGWSAVKRERFSVKSVLYKASSDFGGPCWDSGCANPGYKESRHSHLQESFSQTLDKADVSRIGQRSLGRRMGEEQLWCFECRGGDEKGKVLYKVKGEKSDDSRTFSFEMGDDSEVTVSSSSITAQMVHLTFTLSSRAGRGIGWRSCDLRQGWPGGRE